MKKYFAYILFIVLCVVLVGCGKNALEENGGVLEVVESAHYVYTESLEQMLERSNYTIVRCSVKSRSESKVIDNYGKLSDKDLLSEIKRSEAIANIKTPYELEISKVYLGDSVKSGDVITFNARYGYIEDMKCSYKIENYPELAVGEEYILFLSSKVINNKLIYYFSFPPANALKLDKDNNTFSCVEKIGEEIFAQYKESISELEYGIKTLVENNSYDSTPVIVSD